MPIISQFYGIIIRIYFNDTEKHHIKHIHAQYNEYTAIYSLNFRRTITSKTTQISYCLDGNTYRRIKSFVEYFTRKR